VPGPDIDPGGEATPTSRAAIRKGALPGSRGAPPRPTPAGAPEEESRPRKAVGRRLKRGANPVLLWSLVGGGVAARPLLALVLILAGAISKSAPKDALVLILAGAFGKSAPKDAPPAGPARAGFQPGPALPPEQAKQKADELVALARSREGREGLMKKAFPLVN